VLLGYYSLLALVGVASAAICMSLALFRDEIGRVALALRQGASGFAGGVARHVVDANPSASASGGGCRDSSRGCDVDWLTRLMLLSFSIALSVLMIVFRQATWSWSSLTQFWVSTAAAVIGALCIIRTPAIARAVIPQNQTAQSLAWIRCVVCAGLLILATRVRLSDIALLPTELIRFQTLVSPLVDAWWTPAQLRTPGLLSAIQWVTIGSLVCAMLGLGARPMMFLAALSYTLFYHLQITYTHFYHSGLIPLQILYALCFMPTHRALSLDRVIAGALFRTESRSIAPSATLVYGWCVFVCWTIYGVSYCATGLSKFWVNPWWLSDGNVLAMSLSDSLHIIEYDFNLAARMVNWGIAGFVFPVVGFAAMAIEWGGILILMYGWARLVVPWAIAALHLGIWLCHDFLFYELAVMPLMFLPLMLQACNRERVSQLPATILPGWMRVGGTVVVSALCSVIISGWLYSRDSFPLLSYWGMYGVHANRPLEWVHYSSLYKVRASGTRERTELIEYFSILNHARWLDHVAYTSDPERLKRMKALFAKVYEIEQSSSDPVVGFDIESNSWNVKDAPSDRNFGAPTNRMRFKRDGTVVEEKM
jgi:hypothetical protein